ncbi:hypothetical protein HK097_003964, partial [Rhizophlyctis rosea]
MDPILSFTPSFSQYRRGSADTPHEDESDRESDMSSLSDDGSDHAKDDEDMEEIGISKELLEREREFMKKNQQMQSRTSAVVKKVEAVVKEGKQALDQSRQSSRKPSLISRAAEDEGGPIRTAPPSLDRIASQKLGQQPQLVPDVLTLRGDDGGGATETANRLMQAKMTVMQEEFDKVVVERDAK